MDCVCHFQPDVLRRWRGRFCLCPRVTLKNDRQSDNRTNHSKRFDEFNKNSSSCRLSLLGRFLSSGDEPICVADRVFVTLLLLLGLIFEQTPTYDRPASRWNAETASYLSFASLSLIPSMIQGRRAATNALRARPRQKARSKQHRRTHRFLLQRYS